MIPQEDRITNADDVVDLALHDEIKWRAYELYDRRDDRADCHNLKGELQSEMLRVAYAAAQLQRHANGPKGDSQAVRAARVYLRALSSFVARPSSLHHS